MTNKFHVHNILHMVDDFLILGASHDEAKLGLDIFQQLCEFLGVPLARDKTFGPATKLPFLGIDLCTVSMSAFILLDKLISYTKELLSLFEGCFTTKQHLRQIIGCLNWATAVVQGGQPFIRRFIDKTIGVRGNLQKLLVTAGMKADAKMWMRFLTSQSGRVLFLPESWVSSETINLQSDASKSAGAFVYGTNWFRIDYPAQWADYNIAYLEFYRIVAGLDIFAQKLANHRILFVTDNMAVCHIINSQTSKNQYLLQLLRIFVLICMAHNIHFSASYIESRNNVISDFISRCQPQETWLKDCGLSILPVQVPERWKPSSCDLELKVWWDKR